MLFKLLDRYCNAADAKYKDQLTPLLPRFQRIDTSLDQDTDVKALLKQAGSDPVMRIAQDQFFNANYLGQPATPQRNLG
jgi:hypothetical protein